jgi:hypothetical protein
MAKRILNPIKVEEDSKAICKYLTDYYKKKLGEKAVDAALGKLEEKIRKKLNLSNFSLSDLIPATAVAEKLANFTVFFLKVLYFEGFFTLYQNDNWNPYDPVKQEDQYVEYLLYSWARGKPGYIYWMDAVSVK